MSNIIARINISAVGIVFLLITLTRSGDFGWFVLTPFAGAIFLFIGMFGWLPGPAYLISVAHKVDALFTRKAGGEFTSPHAKI